MRQKLPGNRLREHLENCALTYGCPAAKNFFLGRYEAPLPTSRSCNAGCLGCISLQKSGAISNCQERIKF
ncbi:radical SAM protein, partial [Thermodesulfobacteriota bacterium]